MSILLWISLFGALVCIYLWLRDIRIYYRTGFAGYRRAAFHGIFETALATLGTGVVYIWPESAILGTGIVLLALYLQGKESREKIPWTNEPARTRFFGSVPLNKIKR